MRRNLLCLGLILASTILVTAQTSSGLVDVSGVILNTSGEVIPKAKVVLHWNDRSKQQTTTSNAVGSFRFVRVASGSYEIEVLKEAFKPAVIPLNVGTRPPTPLQVVLEIADLRDEITVNKKGKKKDEGSSANIDLSVSNALNRVNDVGYVGNVSSHFFGLPVAARPARRVQLNFSFHF